MPTPHYSWSDHPNNIWWGVQVMKLHFIQFPPVPSYLILLRPIFLNTIVLNTLSSCFSPNKRDQTSHPYKTATEL
jgi:hypothetical protein